VTCPLCASQTTTHFHRDRWRDYYRCQVCALIFADPGTYLSAEEEHKRYDFHQNDLNDLRYRDFLMRLADPLLQLLSPQKQGLDFGSGPGPLLKLLFEEQGHEMDLYDVFYAPDDSVFQKGYDFISASEVAEHLHHPLKDLDRLWACLLSGGFLGIMTGLFHDQIDFGTWHYIRDDTHVVFYSMKTMRWLAAYWGAEIVYQNQDVVIFRKSSEPGEMS